MNLEDDRQEERLDEPRSWKASSSTDPDDDFEPGDASLDDQSTDGSDEKNSLVIAVDREKAKAGEKGKARSGNATARKSA